MPDFALGSLATTGHAPGYHAVAGQIVGRMAWTLERGA